MKIKKINKQTYTDEERKKIIQYFMELKGDLIREFLRTQNIAISGTKPELRKRIEEALDEGELHYEDLVNFLDSIVPYGKQHVFLYKGHDNEVEKWRDKKYIEELLKKERLLTYLKSPLPLILPNNLSISSIQYEPSRVLKIYAVERRENDERSYEYDEKKIIENKEIELRAYIHQVTRGVMIFTWDLMSNNATLQISQLPTGSKYEEEEIKFVELINPWLNLSNFVKLDLRPVIKKLHELETNGRPEARSHGLSYLSQGGRIITAQSATPQDSIFGEQEVDIALNSIRDRSVGNIGNFYWLPKSINSANGNPLEREVHTIIIGNKSRINFTTPNKKEDIEYVLSRVRILSR